MLVEYIHNPCKSTEIEQSNRTCVELTYQPIVAAGRVDPLNDLNNFEELDSDDQVLAALELVHIFSFLFFGI